MFEVLNNRGKLKSVGNRYIEEYAAHRHLLLRDYSKGYELATLDGMDSTMLAQIDGQDSTMFAMMALKPTGFRRTSTALCLRCLKVRRRMTTHAWTSSARSKLR